MVFQIKPSKKFERSYKLLLKRHYKGQKQKETFQQCIARLIEKLSNNPLEDNFLLEGLPKGVRVPEQWEFRKARFEMPLLQGASGQGRLMYLVDREQEII